MSLRVEIIGDATLYLGDCRERLRRSRSSPAKHHRYGSSGADSAPATRPEPAMKDVLNIYLPEAKRDASDLEALRKITVEIGEVVGEILRRTVVQEVEFHLLLCLGDSFICQTNMPKEDIPLRLRAHANNHEFSEMPPASKC
jgi:hypothetical protein